MAPCHAWSHLYFWGLQIRTFKLRHCQECHVIQKLASSMVKVEAILVVEKITKCKLSA